jgi:hypothetical protein
MQINSTRGYALDDALRANAHCTIGTDFMPIFSLFAIVLVATA